MKHHLRLACIVVFLLIGRAAHGYFPDQNLMVVSGRDAPKTEGDRYHRAVYFIETPEDLGARLYVRIFDADIGDRHDRWTDGAQVMYRLFGKGGIDRSALSIDDPLSAGPPLASLSLGRDRFYDDRWRTFAAVDPALGYAEGGKRVFQLVVDGAAGAGVNKYQVVVSSADKENRSVDGVRITSPAVMLQLPAAPGKTTQIRFPIPETARRLSVFNFDADRVAYGVSFRFDALFAEPVYLAPSRNGEVRSTDIPIDAGLRGREGAIVLRNGDSPNNIQLWVVDEAGAPAYFDLPVLLAPTNRLPVPDIRVIPLSDCFSAVLDAAGSRDPDGDDLSFQWEFPDGQVREGGRIVHDFKTPGKKTVVLTVRDSSEFVANGRRAAHVLTINAPPKAVIQGPIQAVPGETLRFSAAESTDPDGRITRYAWKFDDGGRAGGREVRRRFDQTGRRRVVLTVADDAGDSLCGEAEAVHWVNVNAPPVPRLRMPAMGAPGEAIELDATGSVDSDGRIAAYEWDFGDGETGTGPTVEHHWREPGTYTVRVRVEDDAGLGNSATEESAQIVINATPVPMADYPKVAAAAAPVEFDASDSRDPDGAITDYAWEMGDGTRQQGQKIQHAYAAPGVYTVRLVVTDDTDTLNKASETTFDVRVNHPPVARAGEDRVVNASEVRFDGAGSTDADDPIIDYFWEFGDGVDAHGERATHVYAVPGTYEARLTVTDASGVVSAKQSDTVRIRVNHPPIADAGGPHLVAVDEVIAFDAAPSTDPDGEIASARWDMADGAAVETGRADHAFSQPGVYQVLLTVADNDGAVGTDVAVVTVNAPPEARILPVKRIAPGQTVDLNGAASFDPDGEIRRSTWDFGDGTPETQGLMTRHVFDAPGRYAVTLTVEDDSGALNGTDQAARTVAVNHPPAAEAGADRHVCRQTLRFDASASADPDADPLGFTWDFGDGVKGRGPHLVHTYLGAGLYPVALLVDDQQGLDNSTDQDKAVVQINGPPEAVIKVEGDAHCAGQLILFDAGESSDPEEGPLRYLWDFGDGDSAEDINPIHAYKEGGYYRVRLDVVDDSGLVCDTGRAERILEVVDAPIADAGDDVTVCANVPASFDGGGSTGGSRRIKSYEWDFGDGAYGVGAALSHVYARPGPYTARLTITAAGDGACGNTADDTVAVTVTSAPEAVFTAHAAGSEIPSRVCVGEVVRFDAGASSASGGGQITAYRWDFGDGAKGDGKTAEHVYGQTGEYPVSLKVVTDAETDCAAAERVETVYVNSPPEAVIQAASGDQPLAVKKEQAVRPGTVIRFSGLDSHDADGHLTDYRWDFGDGETAAGPTAAHAYGAAGDYPVVLQVADNSGAGCARNTARLLVRVAAPAAVPIAGPARTCADREVSFALPLDGPAQWHFSDGQTESGNPVARRFAEPGVYGVQAKWGDAWMEALSVNVLTAPEMLLPETVHAFPGDPVTIQPAYATPADMDLIFEWDAGDGTALEGDTLRHEYATPGAYDARLTVRAADGPDCLTAAHAVTVRIHPPPEAEIRVAPETVFTGGARDAARFSARMAGDPNRWTFRWRFGDGGEAVGPAVYRPFRKPGTYDVELTLTDARHHTGRTFSVTKSITVEKRP